MQKVFVADKDFSREFARSRAKGHTMFGIDESVNVFDSVALKTDGTTLKMEKVEKTEDEEIYVILCKEFGLVGEEKKFSSKISVIFLDEGYMLVTLHKGALVINLDEKLMMPSVGVDSVPPVAPDDILWINADYILGFRKYWDIKGQFIHDFELVLNIKGSNSNNTHKFGLCLIPEECIDLSLGYVAQWEQEMKNKEDAKAAKNFASQFLGGATSSAYEFDDDDEYDDDSDGDDDDDVEDIYGF